MAGNAQSSLGQLFVDIGVGGVGKTLKALNSVSASFLLTKNAALQAVKPFIDMGKQALNGSVGIGKMAAALGTTKINAQRLSYYLKQFKSEGLESDVAALQNMFTQIRAGQAGVSGQMAFSLNQLKLDWQDYNGTFEDTLKYIQDIKNALKSSGMSKNEQLMHLKNLGLGQWQYLFEKENFDLTKSLGISDAEIEKNIKADEAINNLKNSIDLLTKKLTVTLLDSGFFEHMQSLIYKLDKWTGGVTTQDIKTRAKTTGRKILEGAAMSVPIVGVPMAIKNALTPDVPRGEIQPQTANLNVQNNFKVYNKNGENLQVIPDEDIPELQGPSIEETEFNVHNQTGL